jgi:membrane protein
VGRARHAVARFWRKAYEDNLTGMASMVAYNLLLSLFPLALIALFIAGQVLSSQEVETSVVHDLEQLFPTAAESTLLNALRTLRTSSTTVGLAALAASLWVGSSFWGALDTAFCRIYHRPCRSWVRQKLFAIGMLVVVLLFFGATVTVPTLQGLVANASRDLPLGLDRVSGLVGAISLAGGLLLLFLVLCLIYWRVPKGPIPWRCIWPGALGAMAAMAVVDYAFPLYLSHVSTLRVGSTLVFVLIVLIWFYALAIILLSGAVVNELRFEHRDAAR